MPPVASGPLAGAVRRRPGAVALLLAGALVVGAGAVRLSTREAPDGAPASASSAPARARAAVGALSTQDAREREQQVRRLLVARASAVAARDRAAFLAVVDPAPAADGFRAQQARLFDALDGVPVSDWHYVLDPQREHGPDLALDARFDLWWAPQVDLRYRLGPQDVAGTSERQALVFVEREGRWFLAADEHPGAAGPGSETVRALWDGGPVEVVRREGVLVLGHPGRSRLLRAIADSAARAVPRVTRLWGPWTEHVVVVVPRDGQEMQGLVPGAGDLTRLAALATAQVSEPDGAPVGDRVVVNPEVWDDLSSNGRRVVLTHEVAHVASRSATGPLSPAWLVEGWADVAGQSGLRLPLRVSARALREQVRAGALPTALPTEADFAGDAPGLESAYEQAWLAVALLVEQYGAERTLELYRAVGRARTTAQVELAWREHVGTDEPAFTRAWRRHLQQVLG